MTFVHPNIPRLYFIKISKWFMLYMPIVVPFYESNGLSMKEIMILQAVYSIAIVLLEIPSGYLADVWGRKRTLLLGAILGVIGFGTYSFSHGLAGFLLAEIILGIGQSCVSGADSAMLYDSLLEKKAHKRYSLFEGRITSLGNFAESGAAIIGGILATVTLRAPYFAQTLVALIAVPAALTLKEPSRHKLLINKGFNEILRISKFALFDNRELRRNILFSAFTGCATLTMAWFVQPFFEYQEVDIGYFGILWAGLNLTVAIASFSAYRIEKKVGQRISILLIATGIPAGFILLSFSGLMWGLVVLFLFYLLRGYATPILKDYINRVTGSEVRATVLSVRNFIIRITFSFAGPLIGWIKDVYSLKHALMAGGLTFMVLTIVTSILFLASREKMNERTDYKTSSS
jgi:MFS family permease